MYKLDLKRQRNQRSNCQHPLNHRKSKGIPEKYLLLLHWLCGSQQAVENSSRNGNTRPSYIPPEKPVCRSRSNRTRHETTDWFKIGKGVCQGCVLSPGLFNLYAEYIMWNAQLDEAQAGIKIAGRNYAGSYGDDITLMAKKQKLKSLLMKVKEESEKTGLEFSFQKN